MTRATSCVVGATSCGLLGLLNFYKLDVIGLNNALTSWRNGLRRMSRLSRSTDTLLRIVSANSDMATSG